MQKPEICLLKVGQAGSWKVAFLLWLVLCGVNAILYRSDRKLLTICLVWDCCGFRSSSDYSSCLDSSPKATPAWRLLLTISMVRDQRFLELFTRIPRQARKVRTSGQLSVWSHQNHSMWDCEPGHTVFTCWNVHFLIEADIMDSLASTRMVLGCACLWFHSKDPSFHRESAPTSVFTLLAASIYNSVHLHVWPHYFVCSFRLILSAMLKKPSQEQAKAWNLSQKRYSNAHAWGKIG